MTIVLDREEHHCHQLGTYATCTTSLCLVGIDLPGRLNRRRSQAQVTLNPVGRAAAPQLRRPSMPGGIQRRRKALATGRPSMYIAQATRSRTALWTLRRRYYVFFLT